MDPDRRTAVAVGALFLTATATYMLGSGLIDSVLGAPDYLVGAFQNRTHVTAGALFELSCGAAVVGIGVLMFPVLKKHSEPLALGYASIRVIEAVIIVVRAIGPLLLVALGREYLRAEAADASHFLTSGALVLELRYWTYQVILLTYVGGLMLSYSLYRSRLVPRPLSVLGFVGHPLVVAGGLLAMFGVIDTGRGAGMALMIPGGLFELLLPIWLFARGFASSAIVPGPANTGTNEIA